jgi:predicted lipid-binding transport protein (Tim44 family)
VTATRKRPRRTPAAARPQAPAVAAPTPRPLPEWKWKTFPVYLGTTLGLFIGLYVGIVVQALGDSTLTTLTFVLFAMLLGFGLSRLTTRFMISRNWVRQRSRRKP